MTLLNNCKKDQERPWVQLSAVACQHVMRLIQTQFKPGGINPNKATIIMERLLTLKVLNWDSLEKETYKYEQGREELLSLKYVQQPQKQKKKT